MNNQTQAQPVAQKSEFHRMIREHLDWGRGYGDLSERECAEISGHYIATEATQDEIEEIFASIDGLAATQIIKMLGLYAAGGSPSARDAAIKGLETCFGRTLKDPICQAFEFALEEMRHEDDERQAERSMTEGC